MQGHKHSVAEVIKAYTVLGPIVFQEDATEVGYVRYSWISERYGESYTYCKSDTDALRSDFVSSVRQVATQW